MLSAGPGPSHDRDWAWAFERARARGIGRPRTFKRSRRRSATARRGRSAARDVSRTYRRAPRTFPRANPIQPARFIRVAPGGAITDFPLLGSGRDPPGYFFDPPHLPGAQPPGAQEPSLPAEELGEALGAAEATSVAATVVAGSARASAVFFSQAAIDKPASTVRAASTPSFMRGV